MCHGVIRSRRTQTVPFRTSKEVSGSRSNFQDRFKGDVRYYIALVSWFGYSTGDHAPTGGLALHRQGPERVQSHCLRSIDDSRSPKSC
jgi:hypothetical protein